MVEQNAFVLSSLTGWKLVGAPLVMMWNLNTVIRYFFPQQPDFQEKRVVFSSVALKGGVTASCKCYPSSAPLLPHVKSIFFKKKRKRTGFGFTDRAEGTLIKNAY